MKLKKTIFLFFILLWATPLFGQMICPLDNRAPKPKGIKSFSTFEKIAVLDQGRIKPLDTYARNILLQFSGKQTLDHKPAIEWLGRLVFAPETTRKDKIFLINNPEIARSLNIEPEKHRRYNFDQLEKHYEKLDELAQAAAKIEEKERSIVDNEILRIHENLSLYAGLSQSFLFAFPHGNFNITNLELKNTLELPSHTNEFSFIDIALRADKLYQSSSGLERKDQSQWTDVEKNLAELMGNLFSWSRVYHGLPLAIVPSYQEDEEIWLSPWDMITQGLQTPEGREELTQLRALMVTYWKGQQLEFDMAARRFNDLVKKRLSGKQAKAVSKVPLEIRYNQLNPFLFAKVCYGFAFLFFLVSLMSERKIFYRAALALTFAGFSLNFVALLIRAAILTRPPVTSLYETFIFVSFVAAVLGLIIEHFNRRWLGIVVASACGLIFLTIAGKFSTEGETMKMLVAVLNSNFWLSTHVLSITTGYAGCCVAGIVGHIYILQAINRPKDKKLLDSTYRNLLGILGFGLAMTFLGTNLGGIWADQSWGRFWGWDPKENGALLIVIWTAMIFHAKIAKLVGPLGVAVLSVLLIIVVMWAWFGVNLLNTGLHSYGFTSGLAFNLAIYVALQLFFLAITVPLAIGRSK